MSHLHQLLKAMNMELREMIKGKGKPKFWEESLRPAPCFHEQSNIYYTESKTVL